MRRINIPNPQYTSKICRKLSKKTSKTPTVTSIENFADISSAFSFFNINTRKRYVISEINENIPVRHSAEKIAMFKILFSPLMSSGKKFPNESKYNKIVTDKTARNVKVIRYFIFLSL